MSEIGDWSSATPAKYTSYNLVRQEMRERSDRSGQQPTYTIKPPAWDGNTLEWSNRLLAVHHGRDGCWWAFCPATGSVNCGTEAAARAWCEAKYYEWVRQFLSEVKT